MRLSPNFKGIEGFHPNIDSARADDNRLFRASPFLDGS
jgi:hypothetical protein